GGGGAAGERPRRGAPPGKRLGREGGAGSRSRRGALSLRVDRLVAVRLRERLRDVRRQGHLAFRLSVEPQQPPPLPQVLEQLDRAVPATLPQPLRPAGAPLPEPVLTPSLEQQDLAARTLDPDPRRNHPRVVDDDELVTLQLLWQLGEPAMPDLPARPLVDE